ncbi:MAG TPA: hypothetical protein VIH42_06490, partial [Thermoguttaceae bacterium]
MAVYNRLIIAPAIYGWLMLCAASPLSAQQQASPAGPATDKPAGLAIEKPTTDTAKETSPTDSTSNEKLVLEQQRIADKYKHFEEVMLQMTELIAQTDPGRAALLKKAIAQSKEELIGVRFERLVEYLEKD